MSENIIEIVNADYIFEVGQEVYEIKADNVFSIDYNSSVNKPSINGVVLKDNKTSSDLGIADINLSNISSCAQDMFNEKADISLSNLSSTGENHFANRSLSNLDAIGEAKFSSKADKATSLAGYGITDGANINATNFSTLGKDYLVQLPFPSDHRIELAVGASGSTYMAQTTGYFLCTTTNQAAQDNFIYLHNSVTKLSSYAMGDPGIITCIWMPVLTAETVILEYFNTVIDKFYFIIAKGGVI